MHCNVVAKMQCDSLEKGGTLQGQLAMTYLGNVLPHADVGIFLFFSVEPQVLLFSLAMVAAFLILQQGDRLGWFSIQN